MDCGRELDKLEAESKARHEAEMERWARIQAANRADIAHSEAGLEELARYIAKSEAEEAERQTREVDALATQPSPPTPEQNKEERDWVYQNWIGGIAAFLFIGLPILALLWMILDS